MRYERYRKRDYQLAEKADLMLVFFLLHLHIFIVCQDSRSLTWMQELNSNKHCIECSHTPGVVVGSEDIGMNETQFLSSKSSCQKDRKTNT